MNPSRLFTFFAATSSSSITGALLAGAWLITAPTPAHATNGQCRWEGGAGSPTYAYCSNEDCAGDGGFAQCQRPPRVVPPQPWLDGQGDGQSFVYFTCKEGSPQSGDGAQWCAASGGQWVVDGNGGHCAGGTSLNGGTAYSNEVTASGAADAFFTIGSSCTVTPAGGSGWGLNLSGQYTQCWSIGPTYRNGLLVDDLQDKQYQLSGPTGCTGLLSIKLRRLRALVCPQPYLSRTKPNGDLDCWIPTPVECPKCGNPVSPAVGTKHQEELDYRAPGFGGLEFKRTFNSGGYFRPPGATDLTSKAADYWRHTYQRALYPIAGNPTLMAIVQRDDGTLRYFDGNGHEIQNRDGAAERLTFLSGIGYTLTRANSDVEKYDTNGRLTSLISRAGVVLAVSYDASGRVSTVTDPFGHELALAYDASSRLSQLTLPGGALITYGYDGLGNSTSVTYPGPSQRTYHYEDLAYAHFLTGITDESGVRFATYAYDPSTGKVASENHAGVDSYQFTINVNPGGSSQASVTDPLGQVRTYYFLEVNGVFKLRGIQGCPSCGVPAQQYYDSNGNLYQAYDFKGNRSDFAYDTVRNLEISRTEARYFNGATLPTTRTTTTDWNANYRLPEQISVYSGAAATGTPLRITSFTYDSAGNELTRTVTDTSVTPNATRTWTRTYDNYGRMLREDGPRSDAPDVTTYEYYTCTTGSECGQLHTVTNALGQVTTFDTYNVHGQPLTITDPNNIVTTLGYDVRQRLISRQVGSETTTFEYWPTGLLKRVTLPDSSFLLYTYDAAHRLTRIDDAAGNYALYTLDGAGNRTAENVYDPSNFLSRTHSRVFNTLGQLWKDVTAAGTTAQTTVFGYDPNGNQTTIYAPLTRNTTNAYDELNRLAQVSDPANGNTYFAYNAVDNLTSVTDPRSTITSYTYTGFGDLKTQVSPDTGATTNTYDSGGNLATSTDARSAITTSTYDALNRLTSSAFKIGSTTDQTIAFTYDAGTNGKGRLTGASDANHSMSWTYTAQGRVASKSQTIGTVTKSVFYGYTDGNLASITTPSGQSVVYGYNSNHQVTSVSVNGTTVLSSVLYDPFGPVRGWSWGNGTQAVRTYDTDGNISQIDSGGLKTFGYDDAFRITSITDTANSANSYTYGYDALDRLTSAIKTGATRGWTYDANGNRLTQTGTGASTYTISSSNNRVSSISGGLTRNYTYDNVGSVLTYSNVTATYNNRGRMKTLKVGSSTATYVYNALGERIKRSGGSPGTVLYWYDEAGHLLGEYNSTGALVEETIWLGDIPVATIRPGTPALVYYVHTDHLNTPRRVTRPSDNKLMWTWYADPFGSELPNQNPASGGTFKYNLRFPGQLYDAHAGLIYNYFRDYDPAVGRYVESDPIGLEGGINTYAYAFDSPTNLSDASGLNPAAAARAGVVAGEIANAGINAALIALTGTTLGGVIYEMCHSDSNANERRCNAQLKRDSASCRAVARAERAGKRPTGAGARCWASANQRFAACLRGQDGGPLDTWNN